jgi:hypothetical protein
LHCELPKPIETQKPKLLAFIDVCSGLAYFPLSHRPHMNENVPSTLKLPFLRFSFVDNEEKTGELKFTSIEIL